MNLKRSHLNALLTLVCLGISYQIVTLAAEPAATVNPARMRAIGEVDTRFQAYNVEMLEVTGGRFWKPYKDVAANSKTNSNLQHSAATPAGMSPDLFEYRSPVHLENARLRKLAAALGPAYLRVSGTWANTTYFPGADEAAPATPPKGFNGVLTREQWKGVIEFARAAHADIITSFAISPGTRNGEGLWTPEQARRVLSYTKAIGGKIAAAEFMNEPTFPVIGGAGKSYDAAAYARDLQVFRPFLKQASPATLFLGPGSVAEGGSLANSVIPDRLRSEDLLRATGPVYDVFSYHLYAAASKRCAGGDTTAGVTAAAALSEEWLSRVDTIHKFYAALGKQFEPGKRVWVTETADAACGGDPWASTFLDTFRYLDEHARLAQQGVRVVAHNTLAASDYGLLDENTFAPRPNYWAALLWHRLMGTTVLKPGGSETAGLHLYAHCLKGTPGGVALLALNTDRNNAQTLSVSASSERYTMTAPNLEGTRVDLNGKELKLGDEDDLPQFASLPVPAGQISLAPASVTFLAVRDAHNASCR